MPRIPGIPGTRIPRQSEKEAWLQENVARICQFEQCRFPGSQPVSFLKGDLARLESQDFWVCEKSDGVRVLLLVHTDLNSGSQEVYLIDRKNEYYEIQGLFFPHHENSRMPLQNTLVDGELVVDVDDRTKLEILRFLAFDCLVVNGQNIMSQPLDKRYGKLNDWFYEPFVTGEHGHLLFDIQVKAMSLSYHAEQVLKYIPNLQHGNDGLIYTCVNAPYKPGTNPNILKWKPPYKISIDFKLVLRFPALGDDPSKSDFHAKPVFLLQIWCGDERGVSKYETYDQMNVENDEWEKMKMSGEQYDDRIVEVSWDPSHNHWRMMRFRDDKPNANYRTVVEKNIQSIADGVDEHTLLVRSNSIRTAWKVRVPPPLVLRYGRLGTSRWSRVAGPPMVAGMVR